MVCRASVAAMNALPENQKRRPASLSNAAVKGMALLVGRTKIGCRQIQLPTPQFFMQITLRL